MTLPTGCPYPPRPQEIRMNDTKSIREILDDLIVEVQGRRAMIPTLSGTEYKALNDLCDEIDTLRADNARLEGMLNGYEKIATKTAMRNGELEAQLQMAEKALAKDAEALMYLYELCDLEADDRESLAQSIDLNGVALTAIKGQS